MSTQPTPPNRQPKGTPAGGQFAACARAEADAVSLEPVAPETGPHPLILPTNLPHLPAHTPDPEVPVRVKDLGDGTALVSYAASALDSNEDQVYAAEHLLREIRGAEIVLAGEDYRPSDLFDRLESSGDNLLDRVAFIRRTGPGTYAADSHPAMMEDWDEFTDFARQYDAAVVLPRFRVEEHPAVVTDPISGWPIRDYRQIAHDIEEVGSGKVFTLHHERVRLDTGETVGTLADDYDGTIYTADDADSRLESRHLDHTFTLETMEHQGDWDAAGYED